MSFSLRDFAFLMIGSAFGANLIYGLHIWLCRPLRPRTVISLPDGILTVSKRLSRDEIREIRRRFVAINGGGSKPAAVLGVPERTTDSPEPPWPSES